MRKLFLIFSIFLLSVNAHAIYGGLSYNRLTISDIGESSHSFSAYGGFDIIGNILVISGLSLELEYNMTIGYFCELKTINDLYDNIYDKMDYNSYKPKLLFHAPFYYPLYFFFGGNFTFYKKIEDVVRNIIDPDYNAIINSIKSKFISPNISYNVGIGFRYNFFSVFGLEFRLGYDVSELQSLNIKDIQNEIIKDNSKFFATIGLSIQL